MEPALSMTRPLVVAEAMVPEVGGFRRVRWIVKKFVKQSIHATLGFGTLKIMLKNRKNVFLKRQQLVTERPQTMLIEFLVPEFVLNHTIKRKGNDFCDVSRININVNFSFK